MWCNKTVSAIVSYYYEQTCGRWRERWFSLTEGAVEKDNECPMKVTFALLADYAFITTDGKLGIVGVFDEFNAPSLPFNLPPFFFVTRLDGEPTEAGTQFQLEILLWDQDGTQLFAHTSPLAFPPGRRPMARSSANVVIGVMGLPITRAGDYSWIIMVNGEERGRLSFHVNPPPPAGGS